VGLSAALFLARQGIRPLLLERHAGTSIHPRATGLAPRTRELMREAGLDERVLAAGSLMARSGGKVMVERLAGADLGQARRVSPVGAEQADLVGRFSPITSTNGICPQDLLEPILLAEACRWGAEVRFGEEVTGLVQDADGVTATVRGPGADSYPVRADYVIAADGAGSGIRQRLGIPTSGPGALGGPMISVLFQADLTEIVRGHEFVVCEVRNDRSEGLLLATNNTDRWVFYISCRTQDGETPADYPPERCREIVLDAIGLPELELELIAVTPWQPAAFTADRVRDGRVFLLGDAAHVMPPSGAYGLNTGIADAHNLAWKLAYALDGRAGTGLLDSYAEERLPVGRFTVEQAMLVQHNPRLHWDLESFLDERERLGMAHPVVVSLGCQYDSAVIADPRPALPSLADPALDLDGHPGTRAPHLWVHRGTERVSTLDTFGGGFVLLAGPAGGAWTAALPGVGERLGVPVAGYRVAADGGLADADGRWCEVAGIKPSGALLVRPDGYVAWRCAELADGGDAAGLLDRALRTALAR
jgi:2-polyprenyl-6-methoxyphenol hydroxylase-like FAD-dependent oxidoreductase